MRRPRTGSPRPGARLGAVIPTILLAAAVASASVALPEDDAGPAPGLRVAATSGDLSPSNSREGAAILTGSNMRPGAGASGTVTIANPSDAPAAATLSASALSDVPGPLGGSLSSMLVLSVDDITDPASPARVFEGKHSAMGRVSLGTYPAGAARSYRFTVSMPDGGAPPSEGSGDNLYKGASMSVQYDWSMADPPAPTPPPPPVPPGASPPAPPSPPSTAPVRLPSLAVRRTLRVDAKGNLRLPIACPGPSDCAGTVALWTIPRAKRSSAEVRAAKRGRKLEPRKTLARRGFRVRASRTTNVPVRLNRRGRRLLKRKGRLRVDATVGTRDAAGRPRRTNARIKLKASRGKGSRGRR